MKHIKTIPFKDIVTKVRKMPLWKKYSPWVWTLLTIGIITLFYIILNFFTAFGDQTPSPNTKLSLSLSDMSAFEKSTAASINSSVETGSPITILTNGEEFLPDILSEIKQAKKSIYATDYIWDNGDFGTTLLQALSEKAKEGVKVYVLLDGISGKHANKKYIQDIIDNGGEVTYFRPVKWYNISRIDRRTHVRDFVIDGTTAYLGGIAISDSWLGNATTSTSWHDFMFKVHGVAAQRLAYIFANMWSQTAGEIIQPDASTTPQTSSSSSHFISLFSSPAPDMSSNMEHFIWTSILASNKSIHIVNPYLLPSKSIREALENKARQGIDVKIIVPGKNTDTKYTRWASQSYYKELLASGVKIYEYQPSRIHAKTMTMDGVWSIIGSANLDNRSSQINLELILGVDDPKFAKDLESKFDEDIQKSTEITKEAWAKHSWVLLPLELVSRLFIRQY